jgi:hypothetical protein
MKRQELDLDQQQQKNWADGKCDPGNPIQKPAEGTLADFARSGEKLNKNVTRQLAP